MSSDESLRDLFGSYLSLDIGAARALPMSTYTSQRLYELELAQIFRKEWLCVGRLEQVRSAGDYFTVEILGEPIVIVRGSDHVLRALSAVCRHRYYSVVEGAGNAAGFTCPYHKWRYSLAGELRGAPHMGPMQELVQQNCQLPRLPLETWQGFIFISLDQNAPPLLPGLRSAEVHWQQYDMEHWRIAPAVDEVWPGNWKLAMETALEGYHVNGLHPDSFAAFMPSRSSTFEATDERWTLFRLDTVFAGAFASYAPFAARMHGKDKTSAPQFGFFPNCAVSCTQFNAIWLTFLPVDVGHTRVIGGNLVHPDFYEGLQQSASARAENAAAIDRINAEDASAMVNLQRNAHSMFAEPGLLCEKERCLLYFYRYLAGRLFAPNESQPRLARA